MRREELGIRCRCRMKRRMRIRRRIISLRDIV
jgi:hypothetical protein